MGLRRSLVSALGPLCVCSACSLLVDTSELHVDDAADAAGDVTLADTGGKEAANADSPNEAAQGVDYAAMILADHPVAYFRLDDATGSATALDSTASPMAPSTSNVQFAAGGLLSSEPTDHSASFDGTAGIHAAGVASKLTVSALSLEFLANMSSIVNQGYVVAYGECCNSPYEIFKVTYRVNGGLYHFGLQVQTKINPVVFTAAPIANVNTTYHVVGTYDGTATMALYINGAIASRLAGEVAIPSGAITTVGAAMGLSIGSDSQSQTGNAFHGRIDEVAIYDHPLTAAQVLAHCKKAGICP